MALISLGLMGAALSSVTLYTKKLGENKKGGEEVLEEEREEYVV